MRHNLSSLARLFLPVAACFFALPSIAHAQVPFTFSYTQNFNTLLNTGNNNPWVDNTTLLGWYSTRTVYQAGDGTGNAGDLYSFGTTGSVERALGSINSGSTSTIMYALQLENLSGSLITSFQVSFVGEQWRNGGNIATADTLTFDYLVTATPGNQISSGGYTAVPALDFTNLIAQNPAGPLDGNLPANSLAIASTLNVNWAPGEFLWLRWTDTPKAGNDHGLAIDDFQTVVIPEPAAIGLVGLTAFAAVLFLRKRLRGRKPNQMPRFGTLRRA